MKIADDTFLGNSEYEWVKDNPCLPYEKILSAHATKHFQNGCNIVALFLVKRYPVGLSFSRRNIIPAQGIPIRGEADLANYLSRLFSACFAFKPVSQLRRTDTEKQCYEIIMGPGHLLPSMPMSI